MVFVITIFDSRLLCVIMTTWSVNASVVHPRFGEFVFLSSEQDSFVLNNCRVDTSDRSVDLEVFVSGGSRDQAIHRAGRVFHSIIRSINLSGDSVFAQIHEDQPVEVPADEADAAITVDCPTDEQDSAHNILLVNQVMERAAPAISSGDVTKWNELYERAGEKNRRRIKDLVRGSFLIAFDREMGNFYGYKVLDTILDDEFSHLRERSRFSRGKAKHHVRGLRNTFRHADEDVSAELEQALDTVEGHLTRLERFPKENMLHLMAEETGFYDDVEENVTASVTPQFFRQKAGNMAVISAYRGDEDAIQALKASDSHDYEALMERMEELEREAEQEAAELAEEHVETWKDRFRQAQHARGSLIAHGLLSKQPDETAELNKEFSRLIALGKHLTEKSIRGRI